MLDLDLDARVTDMVDPIDWALANVLSHLFGPLSPQFNLPPGVIVACSGQSDNN